MGMVIHTGYLIQLVLELVFTRLCDMWNMAKIQVAEQRDMYLGRLPQRFRVSNNLSEWLINDGDLLRRCRSHC